MKRLISIIITGALLLGILSAGAFASANTTGDVTEFTVDFGTADEATLTNIPDTNGNPVFDYFNATTTGDNWKVNSTLSSAKQIDGTSSAVRVQVATAYNFTQIKYFESNAARSILAVDFTAPSEGMYDVTALVTLMLNYGMGNIYINGTCVGTIDSYATANQHINTPPDEQPLISAYLKAGEYANTLAIVPNGKASTGKGTMVGMQGVKFTKRETEGFEVDFGTAGGQYISGVVTGDNWKLDAATANTAAAQIDGSDDAVRIQRAVFYNFTTFKNRGKMTVRFTASEGAGMYAVAALVTKSSRGTGDVYINGEKVGTLAAATAGDYSAYTGINSAIYWENEKQNLSTVYLHGGENANTLTVVPTSSSNVVLKGFAFDKTTVSGDSFELNFGTADEATLSPEIKDSGAIYDYFNESTAGYNWKVDADATASGQKDGTTHAPRIQLTVGSSPENTLNFITIKDRGDLALKFTAPTGAGTYDVSAIVNPMTGGGYGDIYVNGKYIGSVDSYDTTAHLYNSAVVTQDLYTAELYDGEYANTLVITPAGDENVFMQSFTFDKTTGEGSADEISVEKYVTSGLATVDAISAYMTDGTLIGSNVIGSGHVAIGGVYTVTAPDKSAEGYNFLYWAKGTSDKKRIVGYGDTLTYNPQEGRTSLIAVYEKADSVTNKAEFYNANGELIESNATGVFPAFPSMAGLRQATGWKCWNDGKIYDGSEAVAPEGTVIYVADYGELSEVFVNGDKYTYGDPVTLTATEANFKGWVKNGELVSTNKTYTFLAYETCTVTEMTGDKELSAKLVKIALDDFVSGDITAVMAEFIGLDNAVEKGIMFDNGETVSKIAMTGDGNQFTVTADEEGTYTGYAVIRKGSSFTIIEDGEYVHGN